MRFLQVIFLAIWQLTAVPFVAILSANTLKNSAVETVPANQTIIYKISQN